jgi:hypothetical protein
MKIVKLKNDVQFASEGANIGGAPCQALSQVFDILADWF